MTGFTSAFGSQTYSYDASGNRTSTGLAPHNIDLDSNRLLNTPAKANTYDASGNLTGDGTTTYTYSDRGRLQTAQTGTAVTNYAYNGLGQRVKKIGAVDASITQYVYDEQGHLLGEYDFYGRPLQETVYLGDMPIAVLTQNINGTTGAVFTDNSATANVTAVGSWPAATAIAGFYGSNYQTHAATASTSDSFTWRVTLPAVGKYFFQARWPADATRATNATYTITGTDGVSAIAVNQRTNSNTWATLGLKVNTTAGSVATVKLTTSSGGTVAADAVVAVPALATTSVHYVFTDHLGTPRVITRATDNKMVWRWDQADPFGVAQPNQDPAALGTAFKYNPRFPANCMTRRPGCTTITTGTTNPTPGRTRSPTRLGWLGGSILTRMSAAIRLTQPTHRDCGQILLLELSFKGLPGLDFLMLLAWLRKQWVVASLPALSQAIVRLRTTVVRLTKALVMPGGCVQYLKMGILYQPMKP